MSDWKMLLLVVLIGFCAYMEWGSMYIVIIICLGFLSVIEISNKLSNLISSDISWHHSERESIEQRIKKFFPVPSDVSETIDEYAMRQEEGPPSIYSIQGTLLEISAHLEDCVQELRDIGQELPIKKKD